MGKASRDKGKRGEREVVLLAREVGFPDAHRDWLTPQNDGDIGLGDEYEDVYVEVRRRETLAVPSWWAEVEAKAGDRLPVLATRKNDMPWLGITRLERLLALIQKGDQ